MTGRPRNFDETSVLDSAMATFWHHGYEATSYPDLVEVTGLGRQSLYQAFGNKRSLFTAVLQHYGNCVTRESLTILLADDSPTQNIRLWLNRLRQRAEKHRNGCLLTNSAVEISPHDSEIARVVQKELQRVERALRDTVQRAIDLGQLPQTTNADGLATYFFGVAQGLMVMGRLGLSRPKLKQFTDSALAILENEGTASDTSED